MPDLAKDADWEGLEIEIERSVSLSWGGSSAWMCASIAAGLTSEMPEAGVATRSSIRALRRASSRPETVSESLRRLALSIAGG